MKNSLNEFFILISPTQTISQQVAYMKQLVKNAIGHYESEYSKAHISLFTYEDEHNDNFLYLLESHIARLPSFELLIKDFAVFKNGNMFTIYLDIPYRWDINQITERWVNKTIKPHITIAKNLTAYECKIALDVLRAESFSSQFTCEYITALKRTPGSNKWNNYADLWLNQERFKSIHFGL